MRFIHFLIFFFIVSMDVFNGIFCETVAGPEREYELNDSSAEGETFEVDRQPSNVGPPDSHEAMNNRDLGQQHREKRSFEFLVGLINNNSKYEVIRSDPEMNADRGALRVSVVQIPHQFSLKEINFELMFALISNEV
ncbi:hypothetical protein ABEB36_002276 [Hypothenemus hampei]|uniref:Uncharacterized protein n=1 Tax=Hypothenemus hampei TaxID=57062 RepID=A0ABD1F558_HYPHA